MSTPEKGQAPEGVPQEVTLVQRNAPRPTHVLEVPTHGAPTPGVSGSAIKHPGMPTVPEADPVSTAMLLQKMANAFFQAPPMVEGTGAPSGSAPPSMSPSAPGALSAPPTVGGSAPADGLDPRAMTGSAPLPDLTVPLTPSGGALAPVPPDTLRIPLDPFAAPNDGSATPRLDDLEFPASPFMAPLRFDAVASGFELASPLSGVSQAPPTNASKAPVQPPPPTVAAGPQTAQAASVPAARSERPAPFDPHALRREFPILHQSVNGRRLVWLDNAATTQKPKAVIDRLKRFYETENSNVHRAAHTLAARATDAYEGARESVRRFINAPSTKDIIFVRGATEGINLVAQSWGKRHVHPGDEVVITWLEHHANIVPWQQLCTERKATLKIAPVDDAGTLIVEEFEKLLTPKTRLVAFTHVSNALGTITPAATLVEIAHRHGAKVLVDGAQSVSHLRVDVQALDCDFFVFSGHKIFAPTGIGAVFAKSALMDETPPWQGGGNMISDVTFERTQFHPSPARFEAGTGNIADAVGLGAALDWLTRVGLETVSEYEHELLVYATDCLKQVPGLKLYGMSPEKAGVISFTLQGHKTEEVGGLLDKEGIAVRSGHHCAQPILRRLGVEATVRASLAPYNTREDIDALVAALRRLQEGR